MVTASLSIIVIGRPYSVDPGLAHFSPTKMYKDQLVSCIYVCHLFAFCHDAVRVHPRLELVEHGSGVLRKLEDLLVGFQKVCPRTRL